MITLLLRGGLGNQLFQYAAARAAADRIGTDLLLDLRYYVHADKRGSKAPWITQLVRDVGFRRYHSARDAHGALRRIQRAVLERRRVVREDGLGFDQRLFVPSDGAVLVGEFQSPLYFASHREQILSSLHVDTCALAHLSAAVGGMIDGYIGLHVRRGDYLTTPGFAMQDSLAYYRRAIATARAQLGHLPLLIFTDDQPWCRNQVEFEGANYPSSLPHSPPYVDMYLMSQCAGLIIANSSFSWWGGYMGPITRPIFCPPIWTLGLDARNIRVYPPSWTIVEA